MLRLTKYVKQNLVIQTARDEIPRLRKSAEDQVANSQALIERLRSQLAQTDKADEIDAAVDEQLAKIKSAETELDKLVEEKYELQAEYRKLEAEVGPIKYIAEFVYGEAADNTMLEEAVRWVIIIIIFVFDPLAVLLLIASQYTFEFARGRNKDKEWKDYETARGNMIARNEGPKPDTPKEEDKFEDVDQETLDKEAEEDKTFENEVVQVAEKIMEEDKEILEQLEDTPKEEPKKKEQESSEELKEEPTDIEQWNKWVAAAEEEVAKEQAMMFGEDNLKKNEIRERANLVAKYEKDAEWNKAKRKWKDDNPDQNIKDWKQAYVSGRIHELPWAPQEGYVQNAEQNESSVWNKLQDSKNK